VPIGWAKRAALDRVDPAAGDDQRDQRDGGEQQLHQDVRREDRVGPERRRPQALQDAALAVDGDDRDERQHGAGEGEQAGEDRQVGGDETRDAWGVRQSWSPDAAHDHEGDDRDGDTADGAERFAQEDLDLEPGKAPQTAQHQVSQLRTA